MSEYTRKQFEEYKGDCKYLQVGYEYPKDNWEWIDHETYEDYINIFMSYKSMYEYSTIEG